MRGLRFLCRAGEQENVESAVAMVTAVLDHDGADADTAGHCHALLAQLELARLLPAELRRGTLAGIQQFDFDELVPNIAAQAEKALRHVNAVPESVMSAPELTVIDRWAAFTYQGR